VDRLLIVGGIHSADFTSPPIHHSAAAFYRSGAAEWPSGTAPVGGQVEWQSGGMNAPRRKWANGTLDHDGLILQASPWGMRQQNNEPPIYVRSRLKVPEMPFADMTLAEVVEAVLVRPMTQTELTLVMLEQGYETGMAKGYLRNADGSLLRTSALYRNVPGKRSKLN
jgi:hypothetical protein